MRLSLTFFIILFLTASYGINARGEVGGPNTLTSNLYAGSSGDQVVLLQRALNRDQDTRVANAGPGSPGSETSYFGSLTKAAVTRFQEKYAGEVLAPAGLARGSGYVGFYTRAKLNMLSAPTASMESPAPVVLSSITPSPVATINFLAQTTATATPQNPNLENVDEFLEALDNVAVEQGLSSTALATIKEQALKRLATTTDLRATFLKTVQEKSYQSSQSNRSDSFVGGVLVTIKQVFEKVFLPERARAATGAPFGGALLSAFFCEDSATWHITIGPLPPSFATLLTYTPGSQAYLSYNIPFASWLLGEYEPGAGVCIVACPFCVYIPSGGMITPIIGSSPI